MKYRIIEEEPGHFVARKSRLGIIWVDAEVNDGAYFSFEAAKSAIERSKKRDGFKSKIVYEEEVDENSDDAFTVR